MYRKLCVCVLLAVMQSSATEFPQEKTNTQQKHSAHTILFLSDTQQPLWFETLRLKKQNNEEATQKIYSAIEKETSAVALFHLGDFTAAGMFDSYWEAFDAFHSHLTIPIYPAFGKHDYYFFPPNAKENFNRRFLIYSPSWYVKKIEHVAIVVLNSNFSFLSNDEQSAQTRWYNKELAKLDTDSTVSVVIVASHDPPYTNSTIVPPEERVQKEFATPFIKYKKCKIFLSGHAHAYEHFRKEEKDFLVIGGGGGLLHPLLPGSEQRYADISPLKNEQRFFHYVECELLPTELHFNVKMLRKDFSGFDIADRISIPYK